MKVQEFSDAFDTILNSYNTQANFGEGASKAEITLDEYEKSVLLTQAQDMVVKSYFYDNQNAQGQGFDDSTRRQVDFSSLIKTATLDKASDQSSIFDDRGIIFQMPKKVIDGTEQEDTTDVLFILNEKLVINYGTVTNAYWYREGFSPVEGAHTNEEAQELETCANISDAQAHGWSWASNTWSKKGMDDVAGENTDAVAETLPKYATTQEAEDAGWRWVASRSQYKREFVIVPLNYKEYDRENSKAYAQPFKKQAWRLFQNQSTEFDVQSELIPIWDVSDDIKDTTVTAQYRIRYVKRPDPIVLVTLPDNLSIDGFKDVTECTLNPILHMDILNKAVEIAIATRGGGSVKNQRQD